MKPAFPGSLFTVRTISHIYAMTTPIISEIGGEFQVPVMALNYTTQISCTRLNVSRNFINLSARGRGVRADVHNNSAAWAELVRPENC